MIRHILNRRPRKFVADTGIRRRPLIFVDLEFSGMDLDKEVIEIGCLVVDQKNWQIKKEWYTKIKPEHIEKAEPNSLDMVGYSKRDWEGAISLKEAMLKFNKLARGGVLIGYNVAW